MDRCNSSSFHPSLCPRRAWGLVGKATAILDDAPDPIGLCLGTACYVRGNTKNLERLSRELGVNAGESTPDWRYSLEVCRCIGLCSQAPALMIDKSVHSKVQPDQVAEILSRYE
jgi:NADH:ubiquinone oxidoreductase subunit E